MQKDNLSTAENSISPMKPVKKPSLKRNFIYNFISQVLTLVIPLATTPYLSRVLHEEGNGQISFASSIISIFSMFAIFGFDAYGQREIAKCRNDPLKKSRTFWELVIMRVVTTVLSSAVLFSVLFTIGFSKSNDLILIFSIELLGNVFDIQYFFRGEEDFRSIAIRTIFLKLAGLVCVFTFVKTENDVGIYALCIAVSAVASNLVLWPSLHHRIQKINFRELTFKQHLLPCLTIFIPAAAVAVYSIMDKAEIGWFSDNSDYENGCYEQAYKINSMALLLVTVISPILASRNAFDYQNGDMVSLKNHLTFGFQYTWMIGTPLIVGFAVMSPSLSAWFLGPGYSKVPLLMQIMSVRFIVSGFGENLGSDLFIPTNKEKYSTIATCIGAVVNVVSNYFFIRFWGSIGAAITTALSEILVTAILLVFAFKEKLVSWKMIFSNVWRYLLSSGAMFAVIFFMNENLSYSVGYFLLIVLTGGTVYFLFLLLLRTPLMLSFLTWAIEKIRIKKKN